ncbi:hypothetical protein Vretimale_17051 [Volvox reticuliferus]|uniref:EGF-like domain-containing protein n=1 Tax=Volvox reticuliferus TaxID=1737510 RepID=A0A8J4CXM3_9CHLO|nr:hypothetical protein Vretifemale_18657 [Volvox reticuliferus]GIM14016.1 hypothetical protein Vretimale_17051 [Volvox reticuliferus]
MFDLHIPEGHTAAAYSTCRQERASPVFLLIFVLITFTYVHGLTPAAPFLRHVGPRCHENCTKNGNCNGDTGKCDCAFGYEGPTCESRTMPACHTSHKTRSPPLYGTWSLKNCNCFRQLARIGCPPLGDRECLYQALWNVSLACFEVEGIPPDQQTSDVPGDGFANPSLRWYWGQPLLGREAMNETKPPNHHQMPNGKYQLPLDACPQRCNERGICGGGSPNVVQGTCICMASYRGEACETVAQEDCYLSCSGGVGADLPSGTCIQGFCHCPPGRWGLACTRDEYYTSSVGWKPSYAGLRIFVYDLPQNVVHMRTDDGSGQTQDIMYLAEQAFLNQLLADSGSPTGVVTQNPWEANLFMVPTWSYWYTGNTVTPVRLFRHIIQYLRTSYPYWNELGGRNHMLWAVNDRGSCDWHHLEPELHHPIMVTHFGQAARLPPVHVMLNSETQEALERRRNSIRKVQQLLTGFQEFSHVDLYYENMPCYMPEKDVVVVPVAPVWVYPIIHTVYGMDHQQYNHSIPRPITFFFSGGTRTEMMYSQGVRQAITKMQQERPTWNRSDFLIRTAGSFKGTMLYSKFCLAPSGWGWGIRLVETMASGCVPVIVQDKIYQYLWDVLPYDEFSVRISRRNLHRLPQILDAITSEQLATLQKGLTRWHRAFLYGAVHPDGLAYNFTLLSLRRRLTNMRSAQYRRSS